VKLFWQYAVGDRYGEPMRKFIWERSPSSL
jgi:hypothetical protein